MSEPPFARFCGKFYVCPGGPEVPCTGVLGRADQRKQPFSWWSSRPTASMNDSQIVGPTKRKPRFRRSRDSCAGSLKRHTYVSKLPCSSATARKAFAFVIADVI